EIKMYLDACYVSSPEAVWRIFQFKLHDENPTIQRLQLHLPDQHFVTFKDDEAL
ncbi:9381_t:CDS:1, partial [Cetraspora pellucida]